MEPFKEARADVITEFIEAAIHSILYVRGVYPAAIFKPRRKYGTTSKDCPFITTRDNLQKVYGSKSRVC
uniref:HORMA domain-containing protein n=1 Tax=Amphimedon queenslandica TaxID=400682 RepID=A0A1X7TIM5_AMPQE